ncbi:BTB/POZ domain-containing protein [Hibiscus syriacus]|uniref:BTB/POZ domain-containing protein n=1 Tax=Hibiscus syriacus TaxID=106335 RepID=A0A6A3CWA9_HIBSY|nr:BTB/POZ domain-containing protein [Hibiscus syriacus]
MNFSGNLCGVATVNLGKARDHFFEGIFDCIHEITSLALPRMNQSAYGVETTARLAQWRIDNLASCTYRKSDPFKIGNWSWHLSVEKNRVLYVKLYPEVSNLTRDNPPIASFVIRVVCSAGDRKSFTHPEITDKQLKSSEDFVWPINVPLTGKFIIDVEFLDLKTASPNGGEPCSIWSDGLTQNQTNATALACLSRMLTQGIQTDIVINASNGSIGAHRAVLSAWSPVFHSMFSHKPARKRILNHKHIRHVNRSLSADKYDISDLKEACHESLLEDIDIKNVLERLQNAALYQLPKLKSSCMRYLVKFGKIYDIQDDFNAFMQCADRELIADLFHEVLNTWKGF